MYKADNAIIMAAGTSSRFAPLSYELPKALIEVKGEVLIERQIRQLKAAGIPEIILVVGYKGEQFYYLEDKFGVKIVENPNYLTRNNNSSIYAVRKYLKNSYICSADNYFTVNPFELYVDGSYYAAVYADGETKEWCMKSDDSDFITEVEIGGENAWYMLGHAFWSEEFSRTFVAILEREYDDPKTANLLWESIFINHIHELPMKIRKYSSDVIFEFDTLDELREFDSSYCNNTRSKILKAVTAELNGEEQEISQVMAYKNGNNAAAGFTFCFRGEQYSYSYADKNVRKL